MVTSGRKERLSDDSIEIKIVALVKVFGKSLSILK